MFTQPENSPRQGLYNTPWPLELADTWRTQAALGCGLPADFHNGALRQESISLPHVPMLGYTRDPNQVFVMGGAPAFMEDITNGLMAHEFPVVDLSPESLPEDTAGQEVVPYIACIDPLTGKVQMQHLDKGKKAINYSGGALMHANGRVYAGSKGVIYKLCADTLKILGTVNLPSAGPTTIYNGLNVTAGGKLVTKCFNGGKTEGWMVMVHPRTLRIEAQCKIPYATARVTIAEDPSGTEYAYLPTGSMSLRYRIVDGDFELDLPWSAEYRIPHTTPANGALYLRDSIVFQDNSVPATDPSKAAGMSPVHLYAQPLHDPPKQLEAMPAVANPDLRPGFNFWKAACYPFARGAEPRDTYLLVASDTVNGLIACYRKHAQNVTLDPLWNTSRYMCSASLAIVPDRDLLYTDDYRDGHNHLVVLRLSTGEQLARVQLPATQPTIGVIIPGLHDDVYLISTEAARPAGFFSRVYCR